MSRAARLTASPITVKDRRVGEPRSPTNTGPAFTPMRRSRSGISSRTNAVARSIRSSSSPSESGAPAVRINLPPSGYTSLPSQCTPNSASAAATVAASCSRRSPSGVGLSRLEQRRRCARTCRTDRHSAVLARRADRDLVVLRRGNERRDCMFRSRCVGQHDLVVERDDRRRSRRPSCSRPSHAGRHRAAAAADSRI